MLLTCGFPYLEISDVANIWISCQCSGRSRSCVTSALNAPIRKRSPRNCDILLFKIWICLCRLCRLCRLEYEYFFLKIFVILVKAHDILKCYTQLPIYRTRFSEIPGLSDGKARSQFYVFYFFQKKSWIKLDIWQCW